MKRSLQTKIVIPVLLAQALLAGGLLMAGRHALKLQMRIGLTAALTGRAMTIAALVRYPEGKPSGLEFIKGPLLPTSLDPRFTDMYKVFGPDGQVVVSSPNWPKDLGSGMNLPSGLWIVAAGGREVRGIRLDHVPLIEEKTATSVSPDTLTVLYATPGMSTGEQLTRIMSFIVCLGMLLLIGTGAFAAWHVRRSLSPLRELALQAEHISAKQWCFEPPRGSEELAELAPLVQSLQTMLLGLRHAFSSQREFVANAAHQLKTPVAIEKTTLQLLLLQDLPAEEYKRGIQMAMHDSERIEELLQRLFRLTYAEDVAAEALPSELPLVSLHDSCETALASIRPYAESCGVLLPFSANGNVWVKADPDDLLTVWTNLLDNAIHYSSRGQRITLSISALGESEVAVTVADQGCGIGPADQERIFERFYRGDQTRTRHSGGFGLGLAIVRTLVDAYGGSISVKSEIGRGATFTVRLPIQHVTMDSVDFDTAPANTEGLPFITA